KEGHNQKLLPKGISDPRIAVEANRIRLGFRYGSEPWSTIISIDMRVWLATTEVNVVALELQGVHPGALSGSAPSLLETIPHPPPGPNSRPPGIATTATQWHASSSKARNSNPRCNCATWNCGPGCSFSAASALRTRACHQRRHRRWLPAVIERHTPTAAHHSP